jgi:hypothetical protein
MVMSKENLIFLMFVGCASPDPKGSPRVAAPLISASELALMDMIEEIDHTCSVYDGGQ